jgi:hypothetical protein
MSTNLHPTNVFPGYSIEPTVAVAAVLANEINANGLGTATGRQWTVTADGTTTTFNTASPVGTAAANTINILSTGSDADRRNRVRLAINGTEDAGVDYGAGLTSAGLSGVVASNGTANTLTLTEPTPLAAGTISTEDTGSHSIASGNTNTGSLATGKIEIPLNDLTIGTNAFTLAEAAVVGGDFRKLAYHLIRKFQEYLDNQESIVGIAVSGGTGYAAGDTISIASGGGTGATATFSETGGVPTSVQHITAAGTGYTSDPTILVTTSTGSGATFTVTRTANTPGMFDVTRGFMVEGSNGKLTRSYEASFTYSGDNLDVSDE